MRIGLVLLLYACSASQAFALDTCRVSRADPQMRTCSYAPAQRYRVVGVVGQPVNLTFGAGETIKRIEWGYSGVDEKGNPIPAWRGPKIGGQAMPGDAFKNNLPVWPLKDGHSQLLVITATEKGEERPYQFDLIARKPLPDCGINPGGAGCPEDRETTSGLAFVYPAEIAAARVAVRRERQEWRDEALAALRLRTDALYGQRNWRYMAHGEARYAALAPARISDNGALTEMQWPGNVPRPSIYLWDPKTRQETIAPNTVREDGIVVVHTTSEWFRLRLGDKAVLDLHNLGWSPNRPDPGTGTTSPDVLREVRHAK